MRGRRYVFVRLHISLKKRFMFDDPLAIIADHNLFLGSTQLNGPNLEVAGNHCKPLYDGANFEWEEGRRG
jgi:hypothetical protein